MAPKTAEKKAPARRLAKGQTYECEVCGLEVIVDEVCGCAEAHEILCCSQPMKEKAPARAAKKAPAAAAKK